MKLWSGKCHKLRNKVARLNQTNSEVGMILEKDMDIFGLEWTISRFFPALSGDNLQMEASTGRCEAVKSTGKINLGYSL